MNKENIIDYVVQTPHNPNKKVLDDMLETLIEENGTGGTGFPTAIIKHDEYDNNLQGEFQDEPVDGYTCLNMTFDDAYSTLSNGEPLSVYVMDYFSGNYYAIVSIVTSDMGVPCIKLLGVFPEQEIQKLYWTADGISTEPPAQPV